VKTADEFPVFVAERFGGKLMKGAHTPNGKACVHEAINVFEGRKWSDSPGERIDLRGVNDASWSTDELRTEHMLRVALAVWDWPNWSTERRQAFARRVASETIRRVLPLALRAAASVHPDAEQKAALNAAADKCADDGTWAAASESAWAAEAAAAAARAAAAAAARAAAESDAPLIAIADIFVEAAEATN
jgi:hypothetical protein